MPNDFDTSAFPLGSTDPRVLYNNAGNEDLFMNDTVNEYFVDRPPFLRNRLTLFGMNQAFYRTLSNVGFESTYLTYGAGVVIQRPTQLVVRSGVYYRVTDPTNVPLTLTGTWATDSLSLTDVGDASLRATLASSSGATLIGRGTSTVNADLTSLENRAATSESNLSSLNISAGNHSAIISNTASAIARDVVLIGDSIPHGAFARNIFMHGWARIIQRMFNAELGVSGYGYTNWGTLGSGSTLSLEIHDVNFSGGSWTGTPADSVQAALSPNGQTIRSPGVGGTMSISVPFFQNRATFDYIQQPGGGKFTVYVNGIAVSQVDTNGALQYMRYAFNLKDAGQGSLGFGVTQDGAGIVDIIGPSYLAAADEPVFHNYSQSGRRLRNAGQTILDYLIANSSTFIMALGHNDQADADTDDTYYAAFVQRIDWIIAKANAVNVKVIVPDCCWLAPSTSRTRAQLRRLATATKGTYVDLPGMIFSGTATPSASYLINTLKMWDDASHPNIAGQKWVAETVARSIGLSCTTKKEAIRMHDYWMPVPLNLAAGVYNDDLLTSGLTSAYRRSGDNILYKINARTASAPNPFPVGDYAASLTFNSRSELNSAQGKTVLGVVRQDTAATVSVASLAQNGNLQLSVKAAFLANQQFDFTVPIAPGTL